MGKLPPTATLAADPFQMHLQAAQTAVSKQDFAAAVAAFRAAVQLQKNSALALAGLGQCLCQLNRPKEGIPFLSQAGNVLQKQAKLTGDVKHLLDLAYQLNHWHDPIAALQQAKAAISIAPHSANAYHIAALSLQGLNQHAEAYSYSLRAVELAPGDSNALILLAVLAAKLGKLVEAKQSLQQVLAKTADPNLARAHRELGVVLDKLGEFALAFKHLRAGGQLSLQNPAIASIDKQAVFQEISQFKAAFDAPFLQSAAERVPADNLPSPVFLIGFYRSGTTLAEQILAAHAEVASSDEAHLIPAVLHELYRITQSDLSLHQRLKSLNGPDLSHLRQYYWQTARQMLGENVMQQRLVDKTALNTLNIELINTLFPEALLLFVLRDPRDVCLSCFMQPFSLSALTANFLSWPDTARFYALIMDYWLSIRAGLSLQWQELHYEAMVNDLEGQFRPIFAKMGLTWSDECSQFYRHAQAKVIKTPSFDQVTKPLYQSSLARWQHYPAEMAEVLPILLPYIKSFGYDESPDPSQIPAARRV